MPVACMGDSQGSENFIAVETLPVWIERDREKAKWKTAVRLPTFYRQEAGDKITQLQTGVTLQEKGRVILREKGRAQDLRGLFQALKPKEFSQVCFEISRDQWLLSFHFFPFWMRMCRSIILCLSLGADHLFLISHRFTDGEKVSLAGQCASVVRSLSCAPKGLKFHSPSGHVSRLWVPSWSWFVQEAADQCYALRLMFLSLPIPLFGINKKYILGWIIWMMRFGAFELMRFR